MNNQQITIATNYRHNLQRPVKEIATLAGCSPSTVYRHTYKSVDDLLKMGHSIGVMIGGKVVSVLK